MLLLMVRTLLAAGAVAALGIAAAPAAATSIQNAATGVPYTGSFSGGLLGNAVFTNSFGTITCNVSTPSGQITNTGSTGNPALGSLTDIDWKMNTGPNAPCDDTILPTNHVDNQAVGLPWAMRFDWLSDNTSGAPNGTVTFTGWTITATFDLPATCTYVGDHADGASTRQLEVDFHNPNNTSGNTELRFVDVPEFSAGDGVCPRHLHHGRHLRHPRVGRSQAPAPRGATDDARGEPAGHDAVERRDRLRDGQGQEVQEGQETSGARKEEVQAEEVASLSR